MLTQYATVQDTGRTGTQKPSEVSFHCYMKTFFINTPILKINIIGVVLDLIMACCLHDWREWPRIYIENNLL